MPTRRTAVMPTRKKASQEVHFNDDLPTLYVDTVATSRRADGLCYLSFATNTPPTPYGIAEQVRLVIDDESLRIIIDDLCETTNYFPEKPSQKRRGPSK